MARFTDSWGNNYNSEEEANVTLLNDIMTDDDLIAELEYQVSEMELLNWIYSDLMVQEKFERDFFEAVDCARQQWVDKNLFEEN